MNRGVDSTQVLVVGAKGMLGTDLMQVLRHRHGEGATGVDLPEADITKPGSVEALFSERSYRVVFNCAAYTHVDGCETNRDLAFRVNGTAVGNLVRAAKARNALLVHVSTDFIFDGEKAGPYVEEDPPAPLSVYGESKLEGERQVQSVGADFLIVRTAWLYGANGKNFVDTVVRLGRERDELGMVYDQIGSPTHTRDLAEALCVLVEHGCRGLFHAVNAGSCSRLEWTREILRLAGLETRLRAITSAEFPRPARVPANSALSTGKLFRETGHAMRPWQEALRDHMRMQSDE